MASKLVELRESINQKTLEVKTFFDNPDWENCTKADRDRIMDLNKSIEEEEVKAQELEEFAGIKSVSERRLEDLRKPVGTVPFPGGQPESRGDAAVAQHAIKSFGEQFLEQPAIKSWLDAQGYTHNRFGNGPLVKFEYPIKTLVTGLSSTSGGAYVITDRQAFVEPGVWRRPLVIRDLVRVLTTGSDTVDYVRIGTPTNNAAIVPEATSTTDDLALKPESAIATAVVTETVKTIAHFIPVTRRALADAPQVRDLIDDFLRYGLDEELEDQMVTGDGVGENFTGILNTAGTQTQAFDTDLLTTTRKARTLVRLNARRMPNAYGFHPLDWQAIDLLQDNEARYFFGGPSVMGTPRLWGLPVVEAEAITQGTGIVADWRAATLWDRQMTQMFVTDSHSDWFRRNILAILAEMRAAFAVTHAAAFVEIDMTA
jgi:HK97 family phage major capsid protein